MTLSTYRQNSHIGNLDPIELCTHSIALGVQDGQQVCKMHTSMTLSLDTEVGVYITALAQLLYLGGASPEMLTTPQYGTRVLLSGNAIFLSN